MGTNAKDSIPPIQKHTIKVETLTPEEEKIIKDVLVKDAKVTEAIDLRIIALKKDIQNIRKAGALTAKDNQNSICARCKHKFWPLPLPFLDRGFRCHRCRFRVCKNCRVRQSNLLWLCSLCVRNTQVQMMTGEWMATGDDGYGLSGSDLIRASFRDRGESDAERDSLRDSDSGVTSSSHASQLTTPEQRSLNNEKGGISHSNYSATDKNSVPTIAVTEETREEDDDLDELFDNARKNNSLLGSRSSLRDSRESLYSVYSNAEENYGNVPVAGEILFHLTFDYKQNVLSVHVKQCKDISPVDTKHNRSDPYIKTYLLPDKTRASKRKSKIRKHTLNPVFEEVLKYPVSKVELDSRTLWVSVWNNDRFGRNDFLGEVTIPLAYYKFDHCAPIWYLLQERAAPEDTSLMTYKGDLFVSLKYVPADMVDSKKKVPGSKKSKSKGRPEMTGMGEVHVLVREAKNLTAMRGTAGSNPFCKGYLLPDKSHQSKQKTPALKKTVNPEWQHILVFDGVDESQLQHHGVELTVWDYEKLASNDFLGGVRLNLGIGSSHGKAADWVDARGEEIEVWQSMMDSPNEWVDAQLPLRASMGIHALKK